MLLVWRCALQQRALPAHLVEKGLGQARSGVISGWALAFIQSFDDLTMTVFLAAPGTETLPVRMFLYIQDNINPPVTSVSACVIAITMTALILLDRFYWLDRVLAGRGDTGR
ncbi:hypothetical protein AC629_33265 [Bradyrhizobium sp. NAS80.1]|nr:hypothetical protein AC629_33265 [Bradyrhizobium sp. NAS80.1]